MTAELALHYYCPIFSFRKNSDAMECGSLCDLLLPNCTAFNMVDGMTTCELADASTILVNPDPGLSKVFIRDGFSAGEAHITGDVSISSSFF